MKRGLMLMASFKERLASAKTALFSGPVASPPAAQGPTIIDATPGDDSDTDPSIVIPIRPGAAVSHFEKQRSQIDSFSEDYADRWDKAKLFAAKIVALLLPIIAVLAIGDELGKYFSLFAGGTFSSYLIAYAGEAALAALTYILGSIFGRSEKSAAHIIKLIVTFVVWLLFVLASAWGQWSVASAALPVHASQGLIISIWLRIGMACMLDAASVAIMFWRGKSLTKYLAQLQQKATATMQVNEAELSIQRAQASAAARQKEDDMYLAGKVRSQEIVNRVQELQSQALIEAAQRALMPGESSGRGRRLGSGDSNW
jgi:hypothetical protein